MYRITETDSGCVIRVTSELDTAARYALHVDRFSVRTV